MKRSPHSSQVQVPLQKLNKTIVEATQTMALPGKSARPLKKRRFVSIEPEEETAPRARSQPPNNDDGSNTRKTKAKRTRAAVSPLPSPSASPATVIKKSVSWNDPGGNVVHVRPDPTKTYPFFNESDIWYAVSRIFIHCVLSFRSIIITIIADGRDGVLFTRIFSHSFQSQFELESSLMCKLFFLLLFQTIVEKQLPGLLA